MQPEDILPYSQQPTTSSYRETVVSSQRPAALFRLTPITASNSRSASQEIPCLSWNPNVMTVFTRARVLYSN
jgi:hypothetical protein